MHAEDKMTRALAVMLVTLAMFVVALLISVALLIGKAKAQHVHQDETIADARVSRFYDQWKRPPERVVSCCNRKDCYAAQIRRGPNGLEYLHKWSGRWVLIPPNVIESNQPDPEDSPDTTSHVCANEHHPDIVYCAVLGGAT